MGGTRTAARALAPVVCGEAATVPRARVRLGSCCCTLMCQSPSATRDSPCTSFCLRGVSQTHPLRGILLHQSEPCLCPSVAQPCSPPCCRQHRFLLTLPLNAAASAVLPELPSLHSLCLPFRGLEWLLYFPILQMGKLRPGMGAMEGPCRSGSESGFPRLMPCSLLHTRPCLVILGALLPHLSTTAVIL